MASKQAGRRQVQNGAQVRITNQTTSEMKFNKDFTWHGTSSNPGFPDVIDPDIDGFFVHLGDADGSSAAVFYYGENIDRAWVLAWDAPANDTVPTSNKVYVVCGTQTVIGSMTADEIRTNLDKASTTANAQDPNSKTMASASVAYTAQTKAAVVAASFGLIP